MGPLPATTVLLVDDDPTVTETFVRMLRLENFDVYAANSAEAGLHLAGARQPDVVILDLHMPLMDGLSFLRCLRALPNHDRTPVAIVTGDYALDEGTMKQLKGLGAEVHFKPLWLEDLVAVAQSLVEASHAQSEPVATL